MRPTNPNATSVRSTHWPCPHCRRSVPTVPGSMFVGYPAVHVARLQASMGQPAVWITCPGSYNAQGVPWVQITGVRVSDALHDY